MFVKNHSSGSLLKLYDLLRTFVIYVFQNSTAEIKMWKINCIKNFQQQFRQLYKILYIYSTENG